MTLTLEFREAYSTGLSRVLCGRVVVDLSQTISIPERGQVDRLAIVSTPLFFTVAVYQEAQGSGWLCHREVLSERVWWWYELIKERFYYVALLNPGLHR